MGSRRQTNHQLGVATSELGLDELERRARLSNDDRPLRLREWIDLAEAWRIAQALRETRGNRAAAARLLGIGRRTLYTKMEKLGLEPTWCVARVAPETPEPAPALHTRND